MDEAKNFEKKLSHNINRHHLLCTGERPVLVAVSGGADSVALLAALSALGYRCLAAHCNYHLRGEESNRDMRHVQTVCSKLEVDLYVRDFDVDERRRATGESLEMACRELRYAWFADLLDRQRAQAIAVAHHREDNAETFMINLLRGSGIHGLTGMKRRNGYVVRPLLDFSRSEIEAYLQAKGIGFVNDSTNAESLFLRNKLRNEALPLLERLCPGAAEGILSSIECLSGNRGLYDSMLEEKRQRYFEGNSLRIADLLSAEAEPRMLLYELISPLGFNMTHVGNILASHSKSGLFFSAGETTLELDRGVLWVRRRHGGAIAGTEVSLIRDVLEPVKILISEHSVAEFRPERNANVAYFDKDILAQPHTFLLRHWQRGDRMRPYGLKGTRLISDIFSDAKLGAESKRNAWLMLCDEEIIWALGLRASALYSITPETRRYLRLEFRP